MTYLAVLAIGLLAIGVGSHRNGWCLSLDGLVYRGRHSPHVPFCLRWLPPAVFGERMPVWHVAAFVATLASAVLVYQWTGSLVAVWMWVWLAVVQWSTTHPVLVDIHSMAFALGAVLAARAGMWWLAIPLALLSGACKEAGPVFAAAWSLEPVLLVGVLAAAWWRVPSAPPYHPDSIGAHPWGAAREKHDLLSIHTMLVPWGAVAVLAPMGAAWDRETLAAVLSLCLGYAQLLRARDCERLYTWAAPALLVLATRVRPDWLMPLLAAHPFLAVSEPRTVIEAARRAHREKQA